MVNSYVVVAIPSRDDYVWKLSSEKVPHLTMLYLDSNLEDVPQVNEFIEHVVKTSMTKFMLEVKDRGTLGDKDADVLFFDTRYNVDRLEDFRAHLMTNDSIFKAYNSAEQYPVWTPHLTMGYPATPAKPDNREFSGVRWVNFDRIALWTSDYEGTEFPLSDIGDPVAAWSETAHKGELVLQHYGIKGMKWGVHKTAKLVGPSKDHVDASVVKAKAKIIGVHALSNKDLERIIKRMDLEVKFKDLKTVQHEQSLLGKGAKWAGRVATDILVNTVSSWFRAPWARGGGGSHHRPSGSHVRVINGSVVPQRQIGN